MAEFKASVHTSFPDCATKLAAYLASLWGSPSRTLPKELGQPGYGMLDVAALTLSNFAEVQSGSIGGNLRITCIDEAERNWLVAPTGFQPVTPLRIETRASSYNNICIFPEDCNIGGRIKISGRNNLVIFAGRARYNSVIDININGHNNVFFWGAEGSSNGLSIFIASDAENILIGEDCMVAQRVAIMNSDMHAVVELESASWLNPPGSIVIEPHVWLGWEAMIMKNTQIGFGSIVGARSLVTRNVPRRAMVAGQPAKLLRTGVTWLRPAIPNPKSLMDIKEREAAFLDAELATGLFDQFAHGESRPAT